MEHSVQEIVLDLLSRPIHAIGPNNAKLLALLKDYPEGSETLVLKILNVFTDGSKPTPSIVNLVKGLLADRGADARFLMLIIGEMDKVTHFSSSLLLAHLFLQAEIIRHLPKLVGTLDETPERKTPVRQMFMSIVEVQQQTNTNQVREAHSKLLTPKELMIRLHDMEKEVGLMQAMQGTHLHYFPSL